jgi:hypothetical protein
MGEGRIPLSTPSRPVFLGESRGNERDNLYARESQMKDEFGVGCTNLARVWNFGHNYRSTVEKPLTTKYTKVPRNELPISLVDVYG